MLHILNAEWRDQPSLRNSSKVSKSNFILLRIYKLLVAFVQLVMVLLLYSRGNGTMTSLKYKLRVERSTRSIDIKICFP